QGGHIEDLPQRRHVERGQTGLRGLTPIDRCRREVIETPYLRLPSPYTPKDQHTDDERPDATPAYHTVLLLCVCEMPRGCACRNRRIDCALLAVNRFRGPRYRRPRCGTSRDVAA